MKRSFIIWTFLLVSTIVSAQIIPDSLTLESSSIWIKNLTTETYEQHKHTTYLLHMEDGVISIKRSHANPNVPEEFGHAGAILHRDYWVDGRWEPMNADLWVRRRRRCNTTHPRLLLLPRPRCPGQRQVGSLAGAAPP